MSKRILMVEDTEDNRQILRDLFATQDYELIEATDGAAGVAMAKSHMPDLILMDIQLPVLDGYEATRLHQGGSGAPSHPGHRRHLLRVGRR